MYIGILKKMFKYVSWNICICCNAKKKYMEVWSALEIKKPKETKLWNYSVKALLQKYSLYCIANIDKLVELQTWDDPKW